MRGRWAFAAVYTSSGAAGLIYQVVWTRLLSLHFGHTVAAAGVVLAAFMGGLAAGALVAGRLTPRLDPRRALIAYAAAELFIALAGLTFAAALQSTHPLLALSYGAAPGPLFAGARFLTAFLLVFVPAAAMGATYPLAIKSVAGEGATGSRGASRLYVLNTSGAAAGALLAGFILIPGIGLSRTTMAGVMLNLAAAAGAWWILRTGLPVPAARPSQKGRPAPGGSSRRKTAASSPQPAAPRLAAAILCLSGFAALLYEVAFTRALAVSIGPTSYAFAAILAAFITGLAIGSALASSRAWTVTGAGFAAALLLLASAAAATIAAWFAGVRLPLLVAGVVADPAARGAEVLTRAALYAAGVLLPLSCALGALFPTCIRLATDDEAPVARRVALVYGANTIGSIAGSLAAAFVLIPWLGVQQTVRAGALVAVAAAGLALAAVPLRYGQRVGGAVAAAAVAVLLVVSPAWDANLMSSGPYRYAADVRDLDLDLDIGLRAGRLAYYKEGPAGTVSVRQLAGTLALAIDGKVDASNGPDMVTQKLLAHLPLLLHPEPRDVCIIGLGSGVTLGAALRHPIASADVVEISPEVVEASSFFAADNGRALDDPRTHLIVGDGRSHLQLTSRRYDVIISEPSNPWMAGVASLFTREFFEAARSRLAPGGIMTQWAHTYDLAEADLQSIVATFASVFPNGTMWLVGEGDLLLVATGESPGPSLDNIARAWQRPGVAADLARAAVFDPFTVLTLYVAGPAEIDGYARNGAIETDDRPSLEFSGPLGIYDRRTNENRRRLKALLDEGDVPAPIRAARSAAGVTEWHHRGQMALAVLDYSAAYDDLARAVRLGGVEVDDERLLADLIEAAGAARRGDEARHLLETMAGERASSAALRLALVRLLAAMGATDEAVARARAFMSDEPSDPRGPEVMASILADIGQLDRLRPLVDRMRQTSPDRDETWYYAAMGSFLGGDLQSAVSNAERAIHLNPRRADAQNLIGSASAGMGQHDRARQAFQASLAIAPREPTTYANLGLLEVAAGNRDAAVAYFVESLSLDPAEETARRGLSAIRSQSPGSR